MTVYITEYGGMAPGPLQIAMEPAITSYTKAASTTSAVTTQAFDPATNYIRVHTDAVASIAVVASTTGVAAVTDKRMAADTTEYFGVKSGHHVAVISNS